MTGAEIDDVLDWGPPPKTARHDIFEEWELATDPVNLQPKVRPALKAVADHLRKYPLADRNQDEINALIDSIGLTSGIPRLEVAPSSKMPQFLGF